MRAVAWVAVLAMLAPAFPPGSGLGEPLCELLPDVTPAPSARLEQVTPGLGAQVVALLGKDLFAYGPNGLRGLHNPMGSAACPLYNNIGGELRFVMEGAQPGAFYLLLVFVDNQPFRGEWHHVFVEVLGLADADGTLRLSVPFVRAPVVLPGVLHVGQPPKWHGNLLVVQQGGFSGFWEQVGYVPVPRQV